MDKKGYAQLQTTHGNINIELYCNWIHRTCYNFIELCRREYYDDCVFHRLVPGFCLQTGDPTGTGGGGESVWDGKPFRDERDSRLVHDSRGIVSMANSGPNTNQSQFFITLDKAPHLDYKHTIFGKVVGGMATIDRIEAIGSDKKEKPLQEVKLLKAIVFTNPIEEADRLLIEDIKKNIKKRLESTSGSALPTQRTALPSTTNSSSVLPSSTSVSPAVPRVTNTSSSNNNNNTISTSAPAKSSFSFGYTSSSTTTTGVVGSVGSVGGASTSASSSSLQPPVTSKVSVISTSSNARLPAIAAAPATNDDAVEAFLKSQAQRLGTSAEPEKRQKSGFGNFAAW